MLSLGMRIIDRQSFLSLPAGTVFAKFEPHVFGDLAIKGDTVGSDFEIQALIPPFEGCVDDMAYYEALDLVVAGGQSPPLDYGSGRRDRRANKGQLFAVWDHTDVVALIDRLAAALQTSVANPR